MVLSGEVVVTHRRAKSVKRLQRLAFWMQRLTLLSTDHPDLSEHVSHEMLLIFLGDGREAQVLPFAGGEQMPC